MDVAVYGRRFTIAVRAAGTLSVQKPQIAAVKAYNRRVNHIGALQSEIQANCAVCRPSRLRGATFPSFEGVS